MRREGSGRNRRLTRCRPRGRKHGERKRRRNHRQHRSSRKHDYHAGWCGKHQQHSTRHLHRWCRRRGCRGNHRWWNRRRRRCRWCTFHAGQLEHANATRKLKFGFNHYPGQHQQVATPASGAIGCRKSRSRRRLSQPFCTVSFSLAIHALSPLPGSLERQPGVCAWIRQ